MKRKVCVGLLLVMFTSLTVSTTNAQKVSIASIREAYFKLDETGEGAMAIYKSLEKMNLSENTVLLAYRGASKAAAAGAVDGVWNKLSYFSDGKSELEKAVSKNPSDVEIRFLRLATQVNAPGFLGYNDEIDTDKAMILKTLSSLPGNHSNAYLYQRICRFILLETELSPSEKSTVNQLIVKFNTKK